MITPILNRLKSARSALTVLGLKSCEALIGAAMAIYLARVMGPSDFGFFAFGLAITTLLAIPIKNGASTLITKHVAIARESSGHNQAGPLIAKGIQLALVYALLLLILLWCVRSSGVDNTLLSSVALVALALPFLCLTGLWEGVLRGNFRPKAAILVGTVLVPFLVLGLAVMLRSSLALYGWQMAGVLYVGSAILINLIALFLVRPYLQHILPVTSQERMSAAAWLHHAAPFAIVTGLLVFNRQIDVILLGILADEKSVGIYRIAAQAGVIVTFGVQAIGHLYSPYLAVADNEDTAEKISKILRSSACFSSIFGTSALCALVILGDDLIVFLAGSEYLPGYPIMVILCTANLAVALNGSTMQALYMQNQQNKMAIVFAAVALFTVASNAILIPFFGMIGAAIATGTAIILWSLGARILACRIWKLSFFTFAPLQRSG